jgi:hypothetical protein
MKYLISKFPNSSNEIVYQVFGNSVPLCHETDEITAFALAREWLHTKLVGNEKAHHELYFWDYETKTETLLDKN